VRRDEHLVRRPEPAVRGAPAPEEARPLLRLESHQPGDPVKTGPNVKGLSTRNTNFVSRGQDWKMDPFFKWKTDQFFNGKRIRFLMETDPFFNGNGSVFLMENGSVF
jgi:hypothetical protein